MRIIIGLCLTALLTLAFGANLMAGSHGGCPKGGPMADATPEQMERCRALMEEFHDKTQVLREDLWAKNTELEALSGNEKADPARIRTLIGEVATLRGNLQKERAALREKVKAEGLPCTMGPGMGHGMGHGGPGMMEGGCGM